MSINQVCLCRLTKFAYSELTTLSCVTSIEYESPSTSTSDGWKFDKGLPLMKI